MSIISMYFRSSMIIKRRRRSKNKRKPKKIRKKDTIRVPFQYLPQCIIEEIFHKLPYNALARSKLVSKEWNSIISCPKFMNDHYNYLRSIEGNNLILWNHEDFYTTSCRNLVKEQLLTSTTAPIQISQPWPEYSTILGSYNGLVALLSDDNMLILWNPLTGKYSWVVSTLCDTLNYDIGYSTNSRVLLGLCYDGGSNEYSVVIGNNLLSSNVTRSNFDDVLSSELFRVYLYNFKDGRERVRSKGSLDVRLLDKMSSFEGKIEKVIHGIPHWVVEFYDFVDPFVKIGILYFDLKDEKFKQMTCPENFGGVDKRMLGLAVNIDDENQLGCVLHDVVGSSLEVWTMKEYNYKSESWTNLFTIPESNVIDNGLRSTVDCVDVMGFMPSGELLLYLNGQGLWIYDVYKGNRRKVNFEDMDENYIRFSTVVTYQPTLISPPFESGPISIRRRLRVRLDG